MAISDWHVMKKLSRSITSKLIIGKTTSYEYDDADQLIKLAIALIVDPSLRLGFSFVSYLLISFQCSFS